MQILLNILIAYGVICIIFTTLFLIGLVRNIRREVDIVKGVKQAAKTLKIVYVEYDCGAYRMYDKITNSFICQAFTEQELWDIAKARFPDKTVMTIDADKEAKQV